MSNALTTLTSSLAKRFELGDGAGLTETLKATAFKGQVSDAQMTALLIVANQYGLNLGPRKSMPSRTRTTESCRLLASMDGRG